MCDTQTAVVNIFKTSQFSFTPGSKK